jgi:hypothetical protein
VQGELDVDAHLAGHLVRRLGLFDGAGEAVQHVPAVGGGRHDRFVQDVHDDRVGHEVAPLEVVAHRAAGRRAVGDVLA